MKKIISIIGFLSIVFCLPATSFSADYSTKPIIDEQYKMVVMKMNSEYATCGKIKNFMRQMDCQEAIRDRYKREGWLRGTDEYCVKNYGKLSRPQLNGLWKELRQKRLKARVLVGSNNSEPGEVTESMFKNEEMWVEDHLSGMREKNIVDLGKKLFGN